jgi:D-sedoheptulose 7-phosphate isomerase
MTESNSDMINEIKSAFKISGDLKLNISDENVNVIAQISQKIIEAYQAGNKVIIFGNGGSAADAQHIAGELVSKFYKNRRGLPALALHTNTSVLTAVANDFDYSEIFAKQIEAHAVSGDVAIGISTSGNSPNVIKALNKAKELGALTVGFGGQKGSKIDDSAEFVLNTAGHIICYLVEKTLFPD